MTIKVVYTGRDFWNSYTFCEDTKEAATVDDLKKAFRAMRKSHDFAVHVNNTSIVWDSLTDFENGIVTVRTYKAWNNCDVNKMAWEKMKTYILKQAA